MFAEVVASSRAFHISVSFITGHYLEFGSHPSSKFKSRVFYFGNC